MNDDYETYNADPTHLSELQQKLNFLQLRFQSLLRAASGAATAFRAASAAHRSAFAAFEADNSPLSSTLKIKLLNVENCLCYYHEN